MIESAKSAGGVPPYGYESLDQCFTIEPDLGVIILWYNVRDTTKVVMRRVHDEALLSRIAG